VSSDSSAWQAGGDGPGLRSYHVRRDRAVTPLCGVPLASMLSVSQSPALKPDERQRVLNAFTRSLESCVQNIKNPVPTKH
jgi:hypothetical protein